MKQCRLRLGNSYTVGWLEETDAIVGKVLRDGYEVHSVNDIPRLSYAYLNDRSQDYKRTRRSSDI